MRMDAGMENADSARESHDAKKISNRRGGGLVVAKDIFSAATQRFLVLRPRTMTLADGSTPRRLYEQSALSDFPWAESEVFFGGERCVPPDHPASNYRMASEASFSKVPARIHRMLGETCNAAVYESELNEVFGPGIPEFDLVLLRLGDDGHTASLFPGDSALEATDKRVALVPRLYARLAQTLPVLSAAWVALLSVSWESKREALRQLIAGEDIPAARVQAREIVIIADEVAAA